ncbi:hypothetical protein CPB86DRAFT_58140 [Serendipita vermifera]|nr:hypothetical protein CPB86DRAFT_58140 [Serendipita vermifera]
MFNAFRLENLETLDLDFGGYIRHLYPHSFPSRLTEMTLMSVELVHKANSTDQVHSLPHLTNLHIEDTVTHGPFHNYILCPKLKTLHLCNVDYSPEYMWNFEAKNEPFSVPKPTLHPGMWTSQDYPNLETFSLSWMTIDKSLIDESLVDYLRKYSRLQRLTLHDVATNFFFAFFAEYLDYDRFLPYLSRIDISRSWPQDFDMNCNEFIDICGAKRPCLQIYLTTSLG